MIHGTSMRMVVLGSFVQACCWIVARLPNAGETYAASSFSIEAGGKGLNVAIGARRLGAEVDVLLGIGADAAGDDLLRLLQQENISTAHVWRLAAQSGYGAGLIAADGQNMIAVYPGPNLLLNAEHVRKAESTIAAADLVYGQLETSLSAVAAAFRSARRAGVRTVLNPSPWQCLPASLLDDTDVLVVNEVEARELLGLAAPLAGSLADCIALLCTGLGALWLRWPGSLLVVTLGSLGSVALERDGTVHQVPAFHIEAVDSVGAGDAFASGLCVALCSGAPPTDQLATALRYGNACGALMASRFGVLDALPSPAAVELFLTSAI